MINKLKVRIVPPVRNEEIDMQGRRTGAIEQYCKWVLRGNVPRSYIEKKDREFFGGQFWPPPRQEFQATPLTLVTPLGMHMT